MALTGVQIFKLLPKTNCGDCGVPTCLAFAMNLAAGKAQLSQCPTVSEDAKAQLSSAAAPPIRTVEFGPPGPLAAKTGGETVLFRHEKTFFNATVIAVTVGDDEPAEAVDGKLARLASLRYLRVGLTLGADAVAVKGATGDPAAFAALVRKVLEKTEAPLILASPKPDVVAAALPLLKGKRPLLYAAREETWEKMGALAKEFACPLAVRADSLDGLAALTGKLTGMGVADLVLDTGARTVRAALRDAVALRRLAIQKSFRPLGYPTIAFPSEMAGDPVGEAVAASCLVAKYAGIVVLGDLLGETLFPLLLERLNIFTDPQRPMKTDEGLYEFSAPGPDAPVLVTSNFSLTYFIVSGEIENSRQPARLLVVDTDGLSILTAWAAGKFGGDAVAALVKKTGVAAKLQKKSLVLPGAVASILGDVEEEVGADWKVLVGPREASTIPSYLKQNFA